MQKTEKHCKNQCFCYHKTTKISPKTGPKTQKSASGPGHLRNRKKRCCKPKNWGQKVEKHGFFFHFSLADFGRARSRTGVFRTVFYSVFWRRASRPIKNRRFWPKNGPPPPGKPVTFYECHPDDHAPAPSVRADLLHLCCSWGGSHTTTSRKWAMVQHDFADVAFGQRLLSEGRVSWWEESDFLAQLRGSLPKQDLFGRLCEELQPFREQILKDLGPRVKEETCGAFLSARQGQKKGVEVASRPNQGRSLVTTRHLERGFVVIRAYPLAKVLLDLENRSGLPGLKLHPETRLALQLWNAERKGDKRIEAAKDLLDHGGNDASALKMRALLAACCTLCVDVGISRNAACESLFHWLGCVRVNAVAVTALVEAEGEEMQQAKVALALYPDLARSVSSPQIQLIFNWVLATKWGVKEQVCCKGEGDANQPWDH